MKLHDVLLGLVFVAIGAAVVGWSFSFPTPRHLAYGPGLFPRLTGGGLALAGLGLMLGSIRKHEPMVELPHWVGHLHLTIAVLIIPIACLFYYFTSEWLGFPIAGALVLLALMLANKVPLTRAVIVSLAVIVVITLLFASILHVPLPWGVLAPISGVFIW